MHRLTKLTPVAVLLSALAVSVHAFDEATPAAPSPTSPVKASPAREVARNPNIDMEGYLAAAQEAARHRADRRISEEEFLRMSRETGTIVLDARSREKFDLLHIQGAINLSFSDIDIDSLKRTLPDKNARILIYCNNNFTSPRDAFPSKLPSLSLNLSTYIALYQSGYRNVYELGPRLDPKTSTLTFESTPSAR
jgi:phage shock protein E